MDKKQDKTDTLEEGCKKNSLYFHYHKVALYLKYTDRTAKSSRHIG